MANSKDKLLADILRPPEEVCDMTMSDDEYCEELQNAYDSYIHNMFNPYRPY